VKKANYILGGGALLLLIGLAVIVLMARDTDDEPSRRVTVLVAKDAISAGEAGQDVLDDGRAALSSLPEDEVPAGALTDGGGLAGMLFSVDVPKGRPILGTGLRTTSLGQGSIKIPEGKQAIALSVDITAGGAGYAGPGDRVNVYAFVAAGAPGAPSSPYSQLLVSDVEVLDVSREILTPRRAANGEAQGSTGGQLTLLLALDAQQAEAAVFAANANTLWFTLLPEDQGPSETGGVGYDRNYLDGLVGPGQ
jgi:Flp pilus assembly protein CpaB